MMRKNLYKFEWDLDTAQCIGLFKATPEEVESLYGKRVYFGEIAGQNSDVYGIIERDEITLISSDAAVVEAMPEIGYNPIKYVENDTDLKDN